VKLYAESSAVVSWLLGEPSAIPVRDALADAELVLASELTLIECERVLIRAVTTQQMTEADAADRRARLRHATEHWTVLTLDEEIVERARRPFPHEPVRTLDAIHLATAVIARGMVPGTRLLSLDQRLRRSGAALGLEVLPA
jgi:predicted nucleic acid-binding protein